ncbi:MAG: hypothetical protein AB7O62_24510 [Pirellulales bacterium]
MHDATRDDTEFFSMVHRLSAPALPQERMHDRHAYQRIQRVAPVFGGRMPDKAAFREVRCFDLSATGFSYLTLTPPESDELVVALGTPPHLTHFKASVVHETTYQLVGCRFVDRVPG